MTGPGCTNIDECDLGKHSCDRRTEICVDTVGSYRCDCKMGTAFFRGRCSDYNECAEMEKPCLLDTLKCKNTIGTYICECSPGFVYDDDLNDGQTCVNLDECIVNADKCDDNQYCIDTIGSYECLCNPGYMSDGLSGCKDSNECMMNNHVCDVNAECKGKGSQCTQICSLNQRISSLSR